MERYSRQTVFSRIGQEGQQKLLEATVAVVGIGALGTVAANNLCRAGVGHIRMIDRDYVELSNLQRQVLFNEDDAEKRLPKAAAAFNHLSKVNSEITLEPVITDVNSSNIEKLIGGADLVLDATDNWEIRLLVNEACHENKIPWIYCAALGSSGMTMNILPGGDNPCFRCVMPGAAPAHTESCSSFGVLNMITNAIASVQTAEALKILIGSKNVRRGMFILDLWESRADVIDILKNDDCPVCVHKRYESLGVSSGTYTTSLCGSNSIQVVPKPGTAPDFEAIAARLRNAGEVKLSELTLTFSDGKYEIVLFRDGRAMIKNAIDGNNAKSVYTEYIGL